MVSAKRERVLRYVPRACIFQKAINFRETKIYIR